MRRLNAHESEVRLRVGPELAEDETKHVYMDEMLSFVLQRGSALLHNYEEMQEKAFSSIVVDKDLRADLEHALRIVRKEI